MALVLDTGVIFAALNGHDPFHQACRQVLETVGETLVIPGPVLVEVDYLLRKVAPSEAWLAFCQETEKGALDLFPMTPALLVEAAKVQAKYSDLPLGFVDAAVFVACETLGETKVATLDRRHFSVLRTRDGSVLDLLPAGD